MADCVDSTFATRYMTESIPKDRLPKEGLPAHVASQLIKDMRALDARPNLNLASFVTTWMEPEARDIIMDSLNVNMSNQEEYPSCTEMANRCIATLSNLLHSPSPEDPVGAACIGSSEAIMLCGLAMKKRWNADVKDPTRQPNLVMSSATHVCWEKFCRYWDVEPRYVLATEDRLAATPDLLVSKCDENTIGVVAILGTTYTGELEDVPGLNRALDKLNSQKGWKIGIHIDAASGGFFVPFVYPSLEFDFRSKNVCSINVSGHKYGLVYPGVGWAIWRSPEYLPDSMIFYADYLGSLERTITLNFSRGASHIVAQYYQFLRLGVEGYTRIMKNLQRVWTHVRTEIGKSKAFELLSQDKGIPVVAFRLKGRKRFTEYDVSERVRLAGWWVPAYSMPRGAEDHKMMRITIREDMSLQMAEKVLEELHKAVDHLTKSTAPNRVVVIK